MCKALLNKYKIIKSFFNILQLYHNARITVYRVLFLHLTIINFTKLF